MKKIEAKIIADSVNEFGQRLTTIVATFPRFILAELNTHRVFSRNSASSRAIPFKKMIQMVKDDPFIPIAWQKDHSGMQGTEYLSDNKDIALAQTRWLAARDHAVAQAEGLGAFNVTKQLCNRLLEPFMWHTAIITSSEWENYFNLRSSQYHYEPEEKYFKSKKDWLNYYNDNFVNGIALSEDSNIDWFTLNKGQAEIHFMALTESIYDALNESTPKNLKAGEWHIPFGDNLDYCRVVDIVTDGGKVDFFVEPTEQIQDIMVKIATARCARVSYLNFEGKDDYVADLKLFESLSKSGHWSPFEHCAKAMDSSDYDNYMRVEKGIVDPGWCRNFKGFIQLRSIMDS